MLQATRKDFDDLKAAIEQIRKTDGDRLDDLQLKISTVSTEQRYLSDHVKDSIESSRFLVQAFGLLFAVIAVIQVVAGVMQFRFQEQRDERADRRRRLLEDHLDNQRKSREDELELRRIARENELNNLWISRSDTFEASRQIREVKIDEISKRSVESVAEIMSVVHQTLEARRIAEADSVKRSENYEGTIRELKTTIDGLTSEISTLKNDFDKEVRQLTKRERLDIEKKAEEIVAYKRSQFKDISKKFDEFVKTYDQFVRAHGDTSATDFMDFSVRVSYARGVAAHYLNEPASVDLHLDRVVRGGSIPGEDKGIADKRRSGAFYFLGITKSNFQEYPTAIQDFNQSIRLADEEYETKIKEMTSRPRREILTRIALAEAQAMDRRSADAEASLESIAEIIRQILKDGQLSEDEKNTFETFNSRVQILRANSLLGSDLPKAETLLQAMNLKKGYDYYGKGTWGQVLQELGNADLARDLFTSAYAAINALGHFTKVTEARSRILLLMFSALCCQHGMGDSELAETHLKEASELLDRLPKRAGQICSVYSTLSKRNESKSTILDHIGLIRAGSVLAVR